MAPAMIQMPHGQSSVIVLMLGLVACAQVVAQQTPESPLRPVGPTDRQVVTFDEPSDTGPQPLSDRGQAGATVSSVPESGTLLMAGSALIGAMLLRQRRQQARCLTLQPGDRRPSACQDR